MYSSFSFWLPKERPCTEEPGGNSKKVSLSSYDTRHYGTASSSRSYPNIPSSTNYNSQMGSASGSTLSTKDEDQSFAVSRIVLK